MREPVAAVLIAAAVVVSGCASTQSFREGAVAAREGNWDAAVEYYRRALQEDPDRPEYRIALERAMLSAARHHAASAAELEALGDLAGALGAYRRAYELDPSNGQTGVRIANLQQTLRERMEAARAPAPIKAMRTQARLDTEPPLLDPVSDEPLVIEFTDTSVRDVLDFLGEAAGINVLYDREFEDLTLSVSLAGVTFEGALSRMIILDLQVENSTLGAPILVAGQSLPTFGSRKVVTRLRLRDGESNLLAGLLSQEDRQILTGFPGLLRLPILRQLFSANDESAQSTDIVTLLTPRIVRTHRLTQEDVGPIHIGTRNNPGLTGPPPHIAPRPDAGP